jgi:cyanophycin synthetase
VAVLETARGGILRAGMGFDEADVGVVLNVSGDHLGLRGIHTVEQLAEVKGVVAAIVKREGHAVLNADDPLVYGMRERTAADVVLVSTMAPGENERVEDHIARSGIAARVEDDTFVLRRGRLRIPIAPVRDVPLMLGGVAKFQQQNILAAIATAYVQGMRYDDIRAGLLSFFPSPALTPGRLNLMRLGAGRILVDYAHNPAAVAGLMDLVFQLPAARRIGVLTVPGDRRDSDLREVGRLCARLDEVIVKEDGDRRGRKPGEIARIMTEGLVQGGMDPSRISVVLDEAEAVERAVQAMRDGDLTVVLVEDVQGILERLRARAAPATV